MKTKEIQIVPPEGYEIDKENSTFECIKFKPISNVKQNILIRSETDHERFFINRKWAITLFDVEKEGGSHPGSKMSGHLASVFVPSCDGTWYDEKGNKVKGYLFFKPFDASILY